ncbi:MAG: P-II family nitrogen regulator [Planctomycetia bacterium]
MKKIEAVVRHYKLDDVKKALADVGVQGITVSEVRGCGRQHGQTEMYRGVEYTVDLLPKVKIEIAAQDSAVPKITGAIIAASRTGEIGDGKVFITDLLDCVRIRTGESGDAAV